MIYTDLMLDIETLGTAPGCPILSVAAVLFDSTAPLTGTEPTFHMHVDLQDQLDRGAQPSASTIMWWFGQSAAAREALIAGQLQPATVRSAVSSLNEWHRRHTVGAVPPLCWSLPASFDFPLLRAMAAREGAAPAWNHWDERCLRTLNKEYPNAVRPKPELAHDALSDALAQAQWLVNIRAEQRRERGVA